MKCEFEEKQFEHPMNSELAADHRVFSPGQVLECTVGFDAAMFTRHPDLMKMFPWGWSASVRLRPRQWIDLRYIDDVFPPFRFNLFVQYKRPEYLRTRRSKEWHTWKSPYFRYEITPHQQEALERVHENVGDNALVVYASPAFHTHTRLWSAIESRSLVNETNFVEIVALRNHTRLTYTSAGSYGVAFSEPEEIEFLSLGRRLSLLRKIRYERRNSEFVKQTSANVHQAMMDATRGSEHAALYRRVLERMQADWKSREDELALAFVRLHAFEFATGARWLVGA